MVDSGNAELSFHGSPTTTIGVELELQLLDRETGLLAPGAPRILSQCNEEHIDGVTAEFLLSMLEVKSKVCGSVAELCMELRHRLPKIRSVSEAVGYDLAMGGTHPLASPAMAAVTQGERYDRIQREHGWLAYQEAVFGLHVHVGVPHGDAAVAVANHAVQYLPHLLAAAANSPFWQGIDTSYASSRLRMFRPSASCGVPPLFRNWREFSDYFHTMSGAGALETIKDIYWDIRPQPDLGTVEFRIFDMPSDLDVVLGLTALTRCLVADALDRFDAASDVDASRFWLANENRWAATRYGLAAECRRNPDEQPLTLAEDLASLIERVQPVAARLGEVDFLDAVRPSAAFESGADRKRRLYREQGGWTAVIDDMRSRWVSQLDESRADFSPNRRTQILPFAAM